VVSDHRGGDFVHLQAAVVFGDLGRTEPEFAGFFQKLSRYGEVLMFDLLDIRNNLVGSKFLRRLRDEQVLFGKIFRREDVVGLAIFEKKAATRDSGLRNCCRCHVHSTPFNHKGH